MSNNESISCTTPDSISHFRLASLKYQLKMEKAGMKSSGGAIRPRIAKEFGLSPRAPHDEYIKVIQGLMDGLVTKVAQESAEGQTVQ